jgi:hypothetical protein
VFSVYGREFVAFVGVAERDSLGSVSDGANEGNDKSGEGCPSVVTEAQTTAFQRQVSNEGSKVWEGGRSVGYTLEEECSRGLKGSCEGRRPTVQVWRSGGVSMKQDVCCQ